MKPWPAACPHETVRQDRLCVFSRHLKAFYEHGRAVSHRERMYFDASINQEAIEAAVR